MDDPCIGQHAWNCVRNIKHITTNVDTIFQDTVYHHPCAALLDSTRGMINSSLEMMKDGVVVILSFLRDTLVAMTTIWLPPLSQARSLPMSATSPARFANMKKMCILLPHLGASAEVRDCNCAQ